MQERTDNMGMKSAGQGANPPGRCALDDRGFVMVALLVGMAVAAIWLGAAIPAWRQQALREKEMQLIFIGEQYARAIVLYQKKNQGQYPSGIDILVSDRYLRRKWKDPVSGKDFLPVAVGGAPQGPTGPGAGGNPANQNAGAPQFVVGVRSPSQATSIKIYRQQQQHSLWPFDASQLYQKMGYAPGRQGGPGGRPGGPGGRQGGPDGRGGPGAGRQGGPDGRGGGQLPPRGGGAPPRGGGTPPAPPRPGGAGS
jgi:type II secretory pathway pseudopilin PulG